MRGFLFMRLIKLSQGYYAKVDDEDYFWLNLWKWAIHRTQSKIYAVRNGDKSMGEPASIHMHRQILGTLFSGELGDHKNGDGLDNQRHNLRVATKAQNNQNRVKKEGTTSKYIGVNKIRFGKHEYWEAACCKGKIKKRKLFKDEIEAAKFYNKMAAELHGEFAKLNVFDL